MVSDEETRKWVNQNITVAALRTIVVSQDCSFEGICERQEEDQDLKKIQDWKEAARQQLEIAPLMQTLKSYWT